MGSTVFYTVLACGFIIAETAKLQDHTDPSGRHSGRFSSEHSTGHKSHSSKRAPEQISIRLLTSALKNVLSSQDDFVVSDQSVSSSTGFSDSSQQSVGDRFEDLTERSAFPELQLALPNRDLFWQPELQDFGSFGTPGKSAFVKNAPSIDQETSFADQDSFGSNLETSQTAGQSESTPETGNTPESFVLSSQGQTDSESLSTPFSDHQFLDSHTGSQQQSHLDSELFPPLPGDQQSTHFEPPRDFSYLKSESLAPLSLDQHLEVPRSESSQGFGPGNSFPDKEFQFSLSETPEHLTQPKTDSFTAPFPDQQFVVPNAETPDESGHSESDLFADGGHSFLSDSPGHLISSSGQVAEFSPTITFIDSDTPESKSFNVHDHSSLGSQITNFDRGIQKFDGQSGHPNVYETFSQSSSPSSYQSSFNTNFNVDGSHLNTHPGGTTGTPSNQDFYQHSPGLDEFDQTDQGCPGNQIRHVDGQCVIPEISRRLFVIDVPKLETGVPSKQEVPSPKVEENILFIRTPEAFSGPGPIIAPPPQRRDTIFILRESPQGQDRRIIEVDTPPPQRPNVYFLNYDAGQRPTLPDGIDLETALQSAVRIEGKVIAASEEGKVAAGFASNSDALLTHNSNIHTHGVASETSIPEHDVRRHSVNDFISPVPDFLSSGSSDFNPTVNIAHSTSGNINFGSTAAFR
ncbi:uncharacterized protein LOC135204266 isoform X2 [Macrobrachium nipponense]|uniref:uncharacterized protein LOC135204266 isoform X2 n=1 Tax=Macrobrachium nipponense TaxID=159736 RepID=UPI0030C87DBA